METVLAFALLWDVRFCSAEDYRSVLDGCAIASEDRRLLQGLANMGRFRESRTDTARLAARILQENLAELDVNAFAEVRQKLDKGYYDGTEVPNMRIE